MKYTGENAAKIAERFGCNYFEHVKDGVFNLHLIKSDREIAVLKIGDELKHDRGPMTNLS